jgi:hypothetical protein
MSEAPYAIGAGQARPLRRRHRPAVVRVGLLVVGWLIVAVLGLVAVLRLVAWDSIQPLVVLDALTLVVYLPAWVVAACRIRLTSVWAGPASSGQARGRSWGSADSISSQPLAAGSWPSCAGPHRGGNVLEYRAGVHEVECFPRCGIGADVVPGDLVGGVPRAVQDGQVYVGGQHMGPATYSCGTSLMLSPSPSRQRGPTSAPLPALGWVAGSAG